MECKMAPALNFEDQAVSHLSNSEALNSQVAGSILACSLDLGVHVYECY